MNLLIVFVILFVLVFSEMGNNHPVDDVWLRLIAIMITTLLVPTLAAFQTARATQRLRSYSIDEDQISAMLKRLTACHSAVWLAASLAIVYSFQWQKIVRGNWQLDRWPLLDEILIIAPVVLSLIASWAIFFDIQTAFSTTKKLKSIGKRFQFVTLRVRVYLAVFLVPMLIAIAAKDFAVPFGGQSSPWLLSVSLIGVPIFLAIFPLILLFIWQTQPLEDESLGREINELVAHHRLRTSQVRIWTTSRQIINAVVAGVFPYFRVILISDGMVKQFSTDELKAILRHEAGHIRRWHLPLRMFFIVLPAILFFAGEWIGNSPISILESIAQQLLISPQWVLPVLTIAYCIYLLLVLTWISKQMEFDADQYAVTRHSYGESTNQQPNSLILCNDSANEMTNALLRFAELMPSQVDRKSFWHPTIRQRLVRLEQLKRNPSLLQRHSEDFVYQQFLLLSATIVFATLFYVTAATLGL